MNILYAIPPLLLLSLLGCNTAGNKSTLSGHWYACAENGDYVEMHLKDNEYRYSGSFINPTNWNEFVVAGDTLVQYDKYLFEDSVMTNKGKFHFNGNGQLLIDYITSEEYWVFTKIETEVGDIDNYSILKNGTIQRAKEKNCPDLRTDEQRQKDSLDRINGFRF